MDRWSERFDLVFKGEEWVRFEELLKEAVKNFAKDDPCAIELARLRKAKNYIESIVSSIDPQLMPQSPLNGVVDRFKVAADSLGNYLSNQSDAYVSMANDAIDEVVFSLLPYVTIRGGVKVNLKQVAKEYSSALAEELPRFRRSVEEETAQVEEELGKAKEVVAEIDSIAARIRTAESEISVGENSILRRAESCLEKVAAFEERISKDSDRIYLPSEDFDVSLIDSIHEAASNSKALFAEFKVGYEESLKRVEEVKGFESYIFNGGDSLKLKLETFESDQKRKFHALDKKIQGLIPGAVSAGLAGAYHQQKISFDSPIRNASRVFYGAIIALMLGSLFYLISDVYFWGVRFHSVGNWESVLKGFVNKLPFYAPAVWLAYYASKRRSEFQRLQQEYSHKEALAKSFESYKKQVADLQVGGDELMALLMKSSIEAISFNASSTLDGKHGDRMPMQDIIDSLLKMKANGSS